MNHAVNPLVRALLRSPFHGVLSRDVMLLTYRGRASGWSYTFPVQYARNGYTVSVLVGTPARKIWWRNLRDGASVRLRLRGQPLNGTASVLSGRDDPAAVVSGLTCFLRRFPRAARGLKVRIATDGVPSAVDVRTAARDAVMVRIVLDTPR